MYDIHVILARQQASDLGMVRMFSLQCVVALSVCCASLVHAHEVSQGPQLIASGLPGYNSRNPILWYSLYMGELPFRPTVYVTKYVGDGVFFPTEGWSGILICAPLPFLILPHPFLRSLVKSILAIYEHPTPPNLPLFYIHVKQISRTRSIYIN